MTENLLPGPGKSENGPIWADYALMTFAMVFTLVVCAACAVGIIEGMQR